MTKRNALSLHHIPIVHDMGSIHIHVVAGGDEAPRLAISMTRMDRTADDAIWRRIAELAPVEYERLGMLLDHAISKLKTPDDVDVWPFAN